MKRFIYLSICVLLLNVYENMQARQYHFARLSIDDGLSHNDITDIIQDKDGFMWFATRDGLNRFDGKKIKIYKHHQSATTPFGVNFITSVGMDHTGTVWIGSKGLSYYNATVDSLEYFTVKTKDGLSPRNTILDIKINSKNWVYFLEENSGVYCYIPGSDELLFYPFIVEENNEKQSFSATAMWVSPDDRVWLGGDKGLLFQLNAALKMYHSVKIGCLELPNDQLQKITGNEHFIYLGFQYSGVIRYDLEKKVFSFISLTTYKHPDAIYVHDILVDKYSLWIATEQGLYIYDEMHGTTTHLQRDYFDPLSLSDDAIYAVYKDNNEGVWLGTYFGGVNYLSLEQSRFIEKYYPLADKSSISGKAVREIVNDPYGYLWIGTEDGGLNRFDPQSRQFRSYSVNQGLNYHNIHGLAVIENQLFIGTYTAGLSVMDLSTGAISHYYVSDDKYNVRNSIYSIYYDLKKRIWIGTRDGVYLFSQTTTSFIKVNGLENIFAHHLCEDLHGNMWFATINQGLICYTAGGEVVEHREFLKEKLGFAIDRLLSIYEDRKSGLWLATSGYGIVYYNVEKGEARCYSVADGLPDDIVYKAIEDYEGNIWFGTNKGLVRLNPENNKVRVLTKKDGLLSNQFNYNSAYKDKSGKLYFGTIEGMVVIDPSEMKDPMEFPPVFLTGFQIYNNEVSIGEKSSPLYKSITHTTDLTLTYNQNTISFDFAVLRYALSQKNACYVMLDGLEKDWTLVDNDLKISYSNLTLGKYTLRIRSSNGMGEWKEVRTLDIQILPPWWKSITAFVFYCVFLILLLVTLYLNTKQKIDKRQSLLVQRMEQEKERESYHIKIEFFTNIAHEIKTPLTLIKAPLEYIQKTKTFDDETTESLATIMKNTDRLLSLTYQLLDFRRVEDKRLVLRFEQTDVVILLQLIYDRFKVVAEQKNIKFSLSLPTTPMIVEVDVENFTKIVSNLFNNALKYCENYIRVELKTGAECVFKVVVENDGQMIQSGMQDKIFEPFVQLSSQKLINPGRGLGLPLARSLTELHGGTLKVDISCIEYNRFVLSLPVRHSEKKVLKDDVRESIKNDHEISSNQKADVNPTLLIVEDNLEMLDFVARKMIKKYNVLRATDGIEAVKILSDTDVDMVISDIMMPNMDGFELLKIIKSQLEYSHIPVILLTAKTNLQSKIEGLELGADAYVEKPFSLEFLLVQIDNILKNRAVVKEMFHKRPLVEANMVALTKADELFLEKLNELIEKNIRNMQFGVDTLAEKMYMSRSSLHRKIKGLSDLTPNDYIRLHRLKKAALLLQEGELRINEIATATGFASSSYFTKSFQQYFGMTPKEFSKNIKS